MSAAAAARPSIDVVVPALDEEGHISRCLDRILAQDYPAELVRVWVVDAGSTDRTAAIVAERATREPRLAIVPNESGERLNAAQAVNRGVAAGEAELVARVDAHTYLAPDYLSAAVAAFAAADAETACVGGQPEQVGETVFGRAVALARGSRVGVGGSVYADRRGQAAVDTVQAGVYRRLDLERLGGFDPSVPFGEDEELNWRLRQSGSQILLDTSLRFEYVTRSTWKALFRQHRNYGESRAHVVSIHPDYLRPYHLAPAGLVSAFALTAAAAPWSRHGRRALAVLTALYGGTVLAGGAAAARSEPRLAPRVAAAIAAMHLGYGVGMLEVAARHLLAGRGTDVQARPLRQR